MPPVIRNVTRGGRACSSKAESCRRSLDDNIHHNWFVPPSGDGLAGFWLLEWEEGVSSALGEILEALEVFLEFAVGIGAEEARRGERGRGRRSVAIRCTP